jgi:hypothetical protein
MHWVEPQEVVQARASFWNQPRIIVPSMLFSVAVSFAFFALLAAIGIRLNSGSWEWTLPILSGTVAGLGFGLLAFINRHPATQQEIELRAEDFVIHGTSECCMSYDRLRGYSIIQAPLCNTACRALLLYPKTNGQFSIGLPENIPDSAIHAVLSQRLSFVTIFDEKSKNNHTLPTGLATKQPSRAH